MCIIISTGNCNCLPLRSNANIDLVPLSYNICLALVISPLKLKIRPRIFYGVFCVFAFAKLVISVLVTLIISFH